MSTSAEIGAGAGVMAAESGAASPVAGGDGRSAPGRQGQLPTAFAEALLTAVRDEAPAADAHVAAAITLGWHLAALAHPGDLLGTAALARRDLVAVTGAGDAAALEYCRSHVEVAFVRLRSIVEQSGIYLPALDEVNACIESARHDARRRAAGELDAKVLSVLSAADFRLGKAYAIGRELLVLTSRPAPDATLAGHLVPSRVGPVAAAIDDLVSALAPHAGHSVRASLEEWRASIGNEDVAPESAETWLLLARQGELWRELLSGEKSGRDMLEIEDYLDAAQRLAERMRSLAASVLWRFGGLVALVMVLFVTGIAIILVSDSGAVAVAGAGSILASAGLTWRGLGGALGGLAGRLEEPLWGAEVDAAVTRAITLLKRQQGRDTSRPRRDVALWLGSARHFTR